MAAMDRGRHFDSKLEQVAEAWASATVTSDMWTALTSPGQTVGITQGYYVTNGELSGFAKPSKPGDPKHGQNYISNPIAAHEKIASDLAYALALPVPPAILWDRGPQKSDNPRHCVISAVPFMPYYRWDQVMMTPTFGAKLVPSLTAAASALMVFDTWIDNRDRVNGGNLLVSYDPASSGARCAYIDFAQTMTFGWNDGPAPSVVRVESYFPGASKLDGAVVSDTVTAVENLPEERISAIVTQVPKEFIRERRQACIGEGLLRRRLALRAAISARYGVL
jgi:hypothetical protein